MDGTVKKRILLVEDEVIIALAERRTLEGYGYQVSSLATGEEALAFFAQGGEADLILMDIDLGKGMDGTQAAQAILGLRDLPVVFLSSHTEPAVVAKTEGITSYGYVVKSSVGTVLDASVKMAFKLFEAKSLLAASEAKQRALISNISDVIAIVGPDALVKYVSPNVERLFGWDPAELLGREAWLTLAPGDMDRVQGIFYDLLGREGAVVDVEFDYIPRDGKPRPVELLATSLVHDPAIGGILITFHEITERKEAEAALRDSEYCLSRAEKAAKIGNWRIDLKTKVISGSEGARLVYGLGPNRLALAQVQALVLPEFRALGDEALRALIEEDRPYDIEAKIRRPSDGAIIDVRSIAEMDREKGVIYGVIQDLTDRRQVESGLKQSEERLRSVIAGTNAGVWEWNIQTGEAEIDSTSLGFLGYVREDLEPFSFATWMALKHPEDQADSTELLRRHLAGETEFYSFESRMRHKDGRWVWILGRGKLIERDAEGRPLRMFGIHMDVSERMIAEETLRESESRLSRAEGLAGIGNWKYLIPEGVMEFSKGMARIFGVEPGRIDFDQVRSIDLPESFEALSKAQKGLIEEGIPYDVEFRIRRPTDGAVLDLRSVADYDREGKILFGIVQDITERKRAEGEIRKLLAEKELILREVQHRIKNNMATMVSLLSLQADVVKDNTAAMALKDAEGRLRSMGVLYDKLYRSDALGELSLREYLPSLVAEVVAEFPAASKVVTQVEVEDLPFDVRKLSTLGILVNEVVTNSMKYAFVGRDRGLVGLEVRREGDLIVLVISDDGVGLPAGVDPEAPESFGLLLVKSLARQLDAAMEVSTQGGTRIRLAIPSPRTGEAK